MADLSVTLELILRQIPKNLITNYKTHLHNFRIVLQRAEVEVV